MICEVYRSYLWRHGYPPSGLRIPGLGKSKGFPKKDARFSKLKNIPDQVSDDEEGIYNNVKYQLLTFLTFGRLLWETLYVRPSTILLKVLLIIRGKSL